MSKNDWHTNPFDPNGPIQNNTPATPLMDNMPGVAVGGSTTDFGGFNEFTPPKGTDHTYDGTLPPDGWRVPNLSDGQAGTGQQSTPQQGAPLTMKDGSGQTGGPAWARPSWQDQWGWDAMPVSTSDKQKQQPVLSREWLRQPEVLEFVQHMAAFAAQLMGHLNGVGSFTPTDHTATARKPSPRGGAYTPDQYNGQNPPGAENLGLDGTVPWGPLGKDGMPLSELQQYEADEQGRIDATKDKTVDSGENVGLWNDYLKIDRDSWNKLRQIPYEELATDARGRLIFGPDGHVPVVQGKGPSQAPGAPRLLASPANGTGNDARNNKLKGEGGAALME